MKVKVKEFAFKYNETDKFDAKINEEIKLAWYGDYEKPEIILVPVDIKENLLKFQILKFKKIYNEYNIKKELQNGERYEYVPSKDVFHLAKGEKIIFSKKPPRQRVFDAIHQYDISIENE